MPLSVLISKDQLLVRSPTTSGFVIGIETVIAWPVEVKVFAVEKVKAQVSSV